MLSVLQHHLAALFAAPIASASASAGQCHELSCCAVSICRLFSQR